MSGELVVKRRPGAPEGFFVAEAEGLEWLRSAGGVGVPQVAWVDAEAIAVERVPTGPATEAAAARFGRDLAATHAAGAPAYGGREPAFIGPLAMPNSAVASWPELYAEQRLLPFLRLARDRGALGSDAARLVEQVCRRLPELAGPAEPPARLHGDLWSGNVLWGADGRGWVIDPAAHGGHRETDLAMLALFGLPHLDRVLAAYREVAPLAPGWRERVPLHQLHPLLVHAALFGSGYGAQAGAAARAALSA